MDGKQREGRKEDQNKLKPNPKIKTQRSHALRNQIQAYGKRSYRHSFYMIFSLSPLNQHLLALPALLLSLATPAGLIFFVLAACSRSAGLVVGPAPREAGVA